VNFQHKPNSLVIPNKNFNFPYSFVDLNFDLPYPRQRKIWYKIKHFAKKDVFGIIAPENNAILAMADGVK
jgi:hypothetical protein